jgi:hypothetical protein
MIYATVNPGPEGDDPPVYAPDEDVPSGKSTVSSRAPESGECASNTTSIGCVSTARGMTAVPASNSTQSLPDSTSLPYPRGGTLACRPPQRQLNVQRQASSSHIRDINDKDWGAEEELTLQKARTSSGIQKYGVMSWRSSAFVEEDRSAGRLKVPTRPILRKNPKLGSRYTCLNCKKAREMVSIRVSITW